MELEEFLQKEKAAKEQETARKAAQARKQLILEADEDDSESDSDSDSDEENEVERALGDNNMDTSEDHETVADSFPAEKPKRKKNKREDSEDADWGAGLDDDGLTKQMLSYDIFLKGNVSKATSFFKTQGGQTQRFRMFPYVEKKRRVDEYGETLDVGMWLRKGKALEEDAESEEVKEAKRRKAEEEAKVCICLFICAVVLRICVASVAPGATVKICLHRS